MSRTQKVRRLVSYLTCDDVIFAVRGRPWGAARE
jgi:hypothetical protein